MTLCKMFQFKTSTVSVASTIPPQEYTVEPFKPKPSWRVKVQKTTRTNEKLRQKPEFCYPWQKCEVQATACIFNCVGEKFTKSSVNLKKSGVAEKKQGNSAPQRRVAIGIYLGFNESFPTFPNSSPHRVRSHELRLQHPTYPIDVTDGC